MPVINQPQAENKLTNIRNNNTNNKANIEILKDNIDYLKFGR